MIYRVFGLAIDSEIELTDLPPTLGPADVRVSFGETPESLPTTVARGAFWQAQDDVVLMTLPRIARFLVRGGSEIVITPAAAASESDLRYTLVHAAMGPLLHQRRALMLHASSVQIGRSTIAFAGHSGAGKSTLLYECVRRGGKMVADDTTALQVRPEGVSVHAGTAVVQLWSDSLAHFGVAAESRSQLRSIPKAQVAAASVPSDASLPLTAIVVIEPQREPSPATQIAAPIGLAKFRLLRTHLRGRRIAEALDPQGTLQRLARVADSVPVFTLQRSETGLHSLHRLADQVFGLIQ